MSGYQVSVATGSVPLVAGRGTVTVSVTNDGPVSARIVLGAFPPAGSGAGSGAGPGAGPGDAAGWASVERPLRDVGAGATEQFTVTFAAATAAAGNYPVRLIAYSATDAPEEAAGTGQTVQVVVPEQLRPAPAAPGRPWWILGVVALVVLAIGSVLFALTRPNDPPAADPRPVPRPTVTTITTTPTAAAVCARGFVPRLASARDQVCVVPAVAAETVFDNNPDVQKQRRPDPPGGPYGPDTCAQGYVWREAFVGDTVCVVPATRSRTRWENALAAQRTAP